MTDLSIALAQSDFVIGNPEQNLLKATDLIAQASRTGSDLVVLPELWASGYDLPNRENYGSAIDQGWFKRMSEAADEHSIAVGGSLIERDQESYYNTFCVFDAFGNLLGAYRKIHLFQLLKEEDYFKPGIQLVTLELNRVKIGLATCYDLRFPELFRAYSTAGVELILVSAEWPARRIAHWDLLLQARAIENQCFLAAVNKTGESQGENLGGRSAVIGPMGEVLAQAGIQTQILYGEIDLDNLKKIRRWMPVLEDRKPDLYSKLNIQAGEHCWVSDQDREEKNPN